MLPKNLLLFLSIVLLTGAGCAQILGFEDVTATDEPGAADAAPTADAAPDAAPDLLACAEDEISPAVGTTLGNNETASNDAELSCGSMNSNDRLLRWRSPATDYYVFDTKGSAVDTVLALFDECDGTELACNNNIGTASESELVRKVELDTELLVVVDGFAGDTGDFTLNVAKVSCPDFDLERQTLPLVFSTTGEGDEFFNECGGNGQEDRAFHWVAPTEGLYAFTVVAPGYRAVVSLIDGSRCEDDQLACSQAAEPTFKSEVVRRLAADQQVSIYVDGIEASGNFDIDIKKLDTTCPSEVLPEGTPVASSFETRTISPSCSFPEIRNGVNLPQELGGKTFQVNLPPISAGCFGGCEVQIDYNGAFSAAVLEGGDCSGAELSCEAGSAASPLIVSLPRQAGQTTTRTLVVADDDAGNATNFTVSMDCFEACP